jgi:hypothetical protein
MNYFAYLTLAFQILGELVNVQGAISADQPFTTVPILPTIEGHKYSITITGTPVA